jgi:hypothetical protein
MALLFFSAEAERRTQVRAVWGAVSPGSPFMAVDNLPDAALQAHSGLFDLMLIDGGDPDGTAILQRFMRRNPSAIRLLVFGSGPNEDWSRLAAHLIDLGFGGADHTPPRAA